MARFRGLSGTYREPCMSDKKGFRMPGKLRWGRQGMRQLDINVKITDREQAELNRQAQILGFEASLNSLLSARNRAIP